MLFWFTVVILLFIIGLVLYWQLIVAEGAYLGAPLVALLYDWTAERYNKIKEFDERMETLTLGRPLAQRLARLPEGMVLDVATGTGRIPLALFGQAGYRGRIVGLDRAPKMLRVARRETAAYSDRLSLIQADAMALPFASNSFPVVTCLEALEFLPDPEKGLAELIRVLEPASSTRPHPGWLLFTNRIGWEARLMPGKTWPREKLLQILDQFPLGYAHMQPWETIYDLIWAQKVEESDK